MYDSGIGGLTTLALLQAKLPGCEYFYLADNARMPFGTKRKEEIFAAVNSARKILDSRADISVFGCNTASVTVNPENAFKLKPALDGLSPAATLVTGTPLTLAGLGAAEKGFMCASTGELAVLTEIQASLRFKSRTRLDMSPLADYIYERLSPFKGAEAVVLGCSHYVYVRREIRSVIGEKAYYTDGNDTLTDKVRNYAADKFGCETADGYDTASPLPRTDFAFTGTDERKKYEWILHELRDGYVRETAENKVREPRDVPR